MKLLFISYNAAIETEIMECATKCGINTFTKIVRMHGAGTHSDPHLDNAIWPGFNNGLIIAVDEVKKDEIMAKIKIFKEQNLKEGVKVFVLPVEEIL
ncbi:MAG: PG0541 family transporter-associated protein [Elusimicrobiota bacterium]